MYQVIIVIHVLLGLGVIGLVLMQQGKGADAGAAFGTGSSGSVFGAQGAASFLSRTTAILAALFFTTSLGLAILNGNKGAAYDLMAPAAVEQDKLAIPNVEGAKPAASVPVVPDTKPQAATEGAVTIKPAEEPVKAVPVGSAEIKETVVPKADDIKPAEQSKKDAPEKGQDPVKK